MFQTIIVAIDLEEDETPSKLLQVASSIAKANNSGLYLLHVIPAAPPIISQYLESGYEKLASAKSMEKLENLASEFLADCTETNCTVRFGAVYREVLAHADQVDADLILLESHKPSVADYLLGSNAARVVRHATCSVLVLR